MSERFSTRMRLARTESGLIYDHIPENVVNGFCNLMRRVPTTVRAQIRKFVCDALDIYYAEPEILYGWGEIRHFKDFLHSEIDQPGWYRFYDLVEVIWELLEDLRDDFENEVNLILRRNFVGYELRNGQIERAGASVADAAVAEARGILRDSRFEGPNDQFLKAVAFYSQRPEPDEENCVKEAVGAVEGVARILLQNDSILLSDAAKELVKRGKVPVTLRKVFDGIYAYRGDAEGVGHGRTSAPEVSIEHAELVLNSSAALIVYLARLYGIEVVT